MSAHLLSERAGIEVEPNWPCDGPLLRLAVDLARRLLPGEFLNQYVVSVICLSQCLEAHVLREKNQVRFVVMLRQKL